jgi:two-component system response regulator YesN
MALLKIHFGWSRTMNKIREFIQKKNLLFKIILSYALIGLLVMTGFSYLILYKVSDNMKAEINKASNRILNQSYNTADILLSSTFNSYSQLFVKNEFISNALLGAEFSQGEVYNINDQLSDLMQTNPLVHSIYIINHNAGLIFSSARTFSTIDNFFDKGVLELLDGDNDKGLGIFVPRVAELSYLNSKETEQKNLISIFYFSPRADGKRDCMVINLDQTLLQELIMKGSGEGSHQMFIVNDQGRVISGPEGWFEGENNFPEEIKNSILNNREQNGQIQTIIKDMTYRTSYVKSGRLGWNFFIITDYSELLATVRTLQTFIIYTTLFCLIIVAITSAFFTRMIYVPIYNLLKRTISSNDLLDKPNLNEYDLLNKSFSLLENKVNTLQNDMQQTVTVSKHSLLRSLIQGTINNKADVMKAMKKLELGNVSDKYQVCLLKIDAFHRLSQNYDMVDISLLKYAIENICNEIISREFKLELLEDAADSVLLLINLGANDGHSGPAMQKLLLEAQHNIEKFLKITVTISVGSVADKAEDLKLSWTGACQSIHYRLVYGTNSLIFYDELAQEGLNDYQYPTGLEKQLMDGLKSGDSERLQELTEEFITTLHQFKYDEIILSLLQLLVITLRTAKEMSNFDRKNADLEIHTSQQELLKLDTLDQTKDWYLALCERIMAERDKEAQSKNNKTIDKLVAYLQENYTDTNVSVELLAQLVGLSPSYVRKIFKEETGKSIAELLAELRFQQAKKLLLETEHPARKIGEMVGFGNTNYFYVLFKKHVGMTPDHYRRENKLETL